MIKQKIIIKFFLISNLCLVQNSQSKHTSDEERTNFRPGKRFLRNDTQKVACFPEQNLKFYSRKRCYQIFGALLLLQLSISRTNNTSRSKTFFFQNIYGKFDINASSPQLMANSTHNAKFTTRSQVLVLFSEMASIQQKSKTPFSFMYYFFMAKKTSRIGKIPAFIKKLLSILDDANFEDYVGWLGEEDGFHIINVAKFTEQVLPKYFKHQNMASFVRQLNMYGFNRTKDSSQHVYFHPKFKKGQINSIKGIKRKNINKKRDNKESEEQQPSEVEESLSEVNMYEGEWQEKYEMVANQNQILRRQNNKLNLRIKELEIFKKSMENLLGAAEKQKMQSEKSERQPNTSASSDKSESRPPVIKKEDIKIEGSSFGFCGNSPQMKQRECYQKLIKGQFELNRNDIN